MCLYALPRNWRKYIWNANNVCGSGIKLKSEIQIGKHIVTLEPNLNMLPMSIKCFCVKLFTILIFKFKTQNFIYIFNGCLKVKYKVNSVIMTRRYCFRSMV